MFMAENMENERRAIEIVTKEEPGEEFKKTKSLEGYDLEGKSKRVGVKYRKKLTSLSL